jgi:hypothetical protein
VLVFPLSSRCTLTYFRRFLDSFDPAAEKTCEELISLALQTEPDNVEALQTLASVRLSQQRQDEAKQCLEKAWIGWKDLDLGASIFFCSLFHFS